MNDNKKSTKRKDLNETAFSIVQQAIGEAPPKNTSQDNTLQKNPHAVALGRIGGLKGGKARAQNLTPEQRSNIAKLAAKARWKKSKAKN